MSGGTNRVFGQLVALIERADDNEEEKVNGKKEKIIVDPSSPVAAALRGRDADDEGDETVPEEEAAAATGTSATAAGPTTFISIPLRSEEDLGDGKITAVGGGGGSDATPHHRPQSTPTTRHASSLEGDADALEPLTPPADEVDETAATVDVLGLISPPFKKTTTAVHSNVSSNRQVAELEVAKQRIEREKTFLQQQLEDTRELVKEQADLLARIDLFERSAKRPEGEEPTAPAVTTADDGVVETEAEKLRYEATNAVDRHQREVVARLEGVAQFHLVTIAALEDSNALLRERLMSTEEKWQQELEALRSEQETALLDSTKFEELAKTIVRKQEEMTKVAARASKLSSAVQQKEAETKVLSGEIETLNGLLHRRDEEILALKEASVVTQAVDSSRFFQSLSNQSKWGRTVTNAATLLDRVSMRTGALLKGNAPLRIFIAIYLLILHLYVFHVVTSVVHVMPHMGSDAHDHIANHLHPGNVNAAGSS